MINKFLLLTLIFSVQLFGYVPTVESLFRNGNNTDIGTNTIIANIKIRKKASGETSSDSKSMMSSGFPDQVIKFYISNEREDNPKLVQVNFQATSVNSNKITSVIYRPEFEFGKLGIRDENILGKMFYSVMSSILNNDGKMMVLFLQYSGIPVKLNSSLINKEKLSLLRRYSEYLRHVSSDENLRNPLKSQDSEKQSEIDEIMKSSFYLKSPFVQKVREGEDFYWYIKTSDFVAKITDEDRHIKSIKFTSSYGEIKFLFDEYLILGVGAKFEVPRKVTIFDTDKSVYEVKISKIQVVDEKNDSYSRRFKEFLTHKNDNNLPRSPKPPFLL